MGISNTYLLLLSHEASMAFVGEERRLVEGRGSQSFIIGVRCGAIRIPLLSKMCLALCLLVVFLFFLLPILFLSLVIIIIGTLCYEMTSLTTFEAGVISPCFVLVGVFLASFERGLETFDDEGHLIFI
jgi:hypothetical protein